MPHNPKIRREVVGDKILHSMSAECGPFDDVLSFTGLGLIFPLKEFGDQAVCDLSIWSQRLPVVGNWVPDPADFQPTWTNLMPIIWS